MSRCLVVVGLVACSSPSTSAPPPRPPPPPPAASPGPLIAAHASLDEPRGCLSCHDADSSGVVAQKCVECHRPLAVRVQQGKGFHASVVVRGKPCEACHADHRGRGFDAMGWKSLRGGRDAFDHALSGWPLEGAHASRACADCHAQRFIGTESLCSSCHAQNPHGIRDRALLACQRCHSTSAWSPGLAQLHFNHNDRKDASVPLSPAEAAKPCAACHPAAKFNCVIGWLGVHVCR